MRLAVRQGLDQDLRHLERPAGGQLQVHVFLGCSQREHDVCGAVDDRPRAHVDRPVAARKQMERESGVRMRLPARRRTACRLAWSVRPRNRSAWRRRGAAATRPGSRRTNGSAARRPPTGPAERRTSPDSGRSVIAIAPLVVQHVLAAHDASVRADGPGALPLQGAATGLPHDSRTAAVRRRLRQFQIITLEPADGGGEFRKSGQEWHRVRRRSSTDTPHSRSSQTRCSFAHKNSRLAVGSRETYRTHHCRPFKPFDGCLTCVRHWVRNATVTLRPLHISNNSGTAQK